MIHFGKADVTSKVADLPIANFHQRTSSFLVAKSAIFVENYGRVLVAQLVTALCRRKAFHVQLVLLGSR